MTQGPRPTLRIATYNIHRCRGMDRRTSPLRIAEVLREITQQPPHLSFIFQYIQAVQEYRTCVGFL